MWVINMHNTCMEPQVRDYITVTCTLMHITSSWDYITVMCTIHGIT